jgi:hypothetical protein
MIASLAAILAALALILLNAMARRFLRHRRARRAWRHHYHRQRGIAFAFKSVFSRLYQRRLTYRPYRTDGPAA